jgi:serine/threonine protein kinase
MDFTMPVKKRIVHRDVKPGSIVALRDEQVKILDFGIALIATARWILPGPNS